MRVMTQASAIPVNFVPFKYGQLLAVDSSRNPHWTGIVPNGEPHVLDFHEFLVISSGKARITLDGVDSIVNGPAVFFTPPHVVRRVQLTDPMQLELVVCSGPASSHGWTRALPTCRGGTVQGAGPALVPALAELTQRMQQELNAPQFDTQLLLDALLTQFLVALNRCGAGSAVPSHASVFDRFESLLEQSHRGHHDVAYYAATLQVTADHLSAVTRARRGCSAKALIRRRLLKNAVQLLADPRMAVAAVASELGFDEPSHFTRFFTRMTGVAPSDYRLRLANHGIRQAHLGK